MNQDLKLLIQKTAIEFRIDANLIEAIVTVESSCNPWAVRFEPEYRWLYNVDAIASNMRYPSAVEEHLQKHSYGLGQVMGSVFRELGYTGPLMECFNPITNLHYMAKHLKKFVQTYSTEQDAVASYNAGSARFLPSGLHENFRYVDKVYSVLNQLRKVD